MLRISLLAGVSVAALAMPAIVHAQDAPAVSSQASEDQAIERMLVVGRNVYRDRTEDINPTLSYDLDFFQQFEPLTVGEMMKRVPGVTFSSDVLEFDGVQMRGLAAQYTTILVNGREIPGQGADGAFFVDRIPAELVEDIEIIRAPSADMSSEGIGGALNIILKDGVALEGLMAKISGTFYGDGDDKARGAASAAMGGQGDGYDYWLGFNVQERRNPKKKTVHYFDDETGELEGYGFEDDTRDGTDWSGNGAFRADVGEGEVRLEGFLVFTDRTETELARDFEGDVFGEGEIAEIADQVEEIDQTSYGLDLTYRTPAGPGEMKLEAGFRGYDEDTSEVERELDEDGTVLGMDDEEIDIQDRRYRLGAEYKWDMAAGSELKIGADGRFAKREGSQLGTVFDTEADIDETILAPYAVYTMTPSDALTVEFGARYDYYDREVTSEDGEGAVDGGTILPSMHIRYDLTGNDRFRLSVARTMRRPDFDLVTPFEEDEAPDDEDAVIGNAMLEPETAWGVDLGYERRISRQGIVGINLFYREIDDLIELTNTGEEYMPGGHIHTPFNIGDGRTYGVEFDVSTPLDFLGLPETGFYANFTYMDSEVEDPFTGEERTFRNQPDYVYNVSLVQNLPEINGSLGASYQKRGKSLATEFHEYEELTYDGNLELFYEQRVTENVVLRLTGTNLLDQEKVETFYDFGENVNEIEYEESSRTYTLTLRAAF